MPFAAFTKPTRCDRYAYGLALISQRKSSGAAPDFPAAFKVPTIRSFSGAPEDRLVPLADASRVTRVVPFLFAHLAVSDAESFALAAALNLLFFPAGLLP